MGGVRWLPAALALGPVLWAGGSEIRGAPTYSAAGVVNAASNTAGPLAPYAIVTLYGANLAYSKRSVSEKDVRSNMLPTELDGVRVLVDGLAAPLYYVSPQQINFLIPYNMGASFPTEVNIVVTLDGRHGPPVRLPLQEAAPALFQLDGETVIATRANWTLVTKDAPARPGEDVILFATGLGRTQPPVAYPQLPREPARIANWSRFRVLLNEKEVPASNVYYAGVTPGFAGLYQVNLRLPEDTGNNPEIRIAIGDILSPAGLRLPVARTPAN